MAEAPEVGNGSKRPSFAEVRSAAFLAALRPAAQKIYEQATQENGSLLIGVNISPSAPPFSIEQGFLSDRKIIRFNTDGLQWTEALVRMALPSDAEVTFNRTDFPSDKQALLDALTEKAGMARIQGLIASSGSPLGGAVSRDGNAYIIVRSDRMDFLEPGSLVHEVGHFLKNHFSHTNLAEQWNAVDPNHARSRRREDEADEVAVSMCEGDSLAETLKNHHQRNRIAKGNNEAELARFYAESKHPHEMERVAKIVEGMVQMRQKGHCPVLHREQPALPEAAPQAPNCNVQDSKDCKR